MLHPSLKLPEKFKANRAVSRPILNEYDAVLHFWEDVFNLAWCDGADVPRMIEVLFSKDERELLEAYYVEVLRRRGHG